MSDLICEVCWTSSWQPCEEGTKDAVPDKITGGWMVCGHCVLQDAYGILDKRVKQLQDREIMATLLLGHCRPHVEAMVGIASNARGVPEMIQMFMDGTLKLDEEDA